MKRFGPRELLECYGRGVFPMADAREDDRVFLIDPEKRGVIPLDKFHVSRRYSIARTIWAVSVSGAGSNTRTLSIRAKSAKAGKSTFPRGGRRWSWPGPGAGSSP